MDIEFATADLCDSYSDTLSIAEPFFADFGGALAFHGPIATCRVFEDNSLVRAMLEEPGENSVLIVDGGGSMRCALVGDQLAKLACDNGWAGIIVNGCIRDSAPIASMPVGVKALATHPLKSVKRGIGDRDVPVRFAGVDFRPGAWVYADTDGIVVSEIELPASE